MFFYMLVLNSSIKQKKKKNDIPFICTKQGNRVILYFDDFITRGNFIFLEPNTSKYFF